MSVDILDPPRQTNPARVIEFLREQVPCPSEDPLVRDAYEHALREYAALPAWRRDVDGFVRYLQTIADPSRLAT